MGIIKEGLERIRIAEKFFADGIQEDYTSDSVDEYAQALAEAQQIKGALIDVFDELAAAEAGLVRIPEGVEDGEEEDDEVEPPKKGTLTISIKSMLAKIGKFLQIPFTWDGDEPLTFESTNTAVCGVTPQGLLIPMKVGTAVIKIMDGGMVLYIFAVSVSA